MLFKLHGYRGWFFKAGTSAVLLGCIVTAYLYSSLSKPNGARSPTLDVLRNTQRTEVESSWPAGESGSSAPQMNENQAHAVPPLILLSYGFIEPMFNPEEIVTTLGHKCATTMDLDLLNSSDAVVVRFSQAYEANNITLPKARRPGQFFVYLSLEPPWPFQNKDFSFVNKDYFNWTMTYRRDSDVFFPYNSLDRLFTGSEDREVKELFYGNNVVERIIAGKTASFTALTVVSHCSGAQGPKHRILNIMVLERSGLRLAKRGHCFNDHIEDPWDSKEFRQYASTFKFFLAFENGFHCRDYVTEKTWSNSLRSGTVPVIMGAPKADVEKIIPVGSFIHADDFPNPATLAKFLNYLDLNATAYAEYFKWRRKPPPDEVLKPKDLGYKQLCQKLWENRIYGNGSKVYHSFKDWYLGQENPECFQLKPERMLKMAQSIFSNFRL